MNFEPRLSLKKHKELNYEWEACCRKAGCGFIFLHIFNDMERALEKPGDGCGARFEFECNDIGQLHNFAHPLERKLVRPPLFVLTIFGILGGIGPDSENLMQLRGAASPAHSRGPVVRDRDSLRGLPALGA